MTPSGEWFTTFDDAWSYFLAREEPLASFFDEFPDDPTYAVEGWLLVPPPEVKRAALHVQSRLEEVSGLRVAPHHFLHVWLRGEHGPDPEAFLDLEPFEVRLPRLNCFHVAVVMETESVLDELDAPATFLPHVSLAYVDQPVDAGVAREALVPLRDTDLGSFVVEELVHVRIPAAKTTLLEPWTVTDRVSLRR